MEKYGLIGYPLGHSFSRKFFTEKFANEGINAEYLNFEIPDATTLLDVVKGNPTLRGLNCTIPHKQAIIPMLDELSDEARRIGAVNVIRISRQPEALTTPQAKERGFHLKGFNSDIIGFTDSIRPLLKPYHTKALVLGTGGASKAICVGLEKMGIEWKYVSRRPAPGQFTYDELTPAIIQEYPVIVNCSPVGMHPHVDECPALPYESMTDRNLLFDLVYNPLETLFMRRGAEQGATVKNGLEMLHLQALASWEFWNK
ncbi:MAG: shikimate dehydrogenase [Bacteroidaceae bacterium]|nr:shikimate dehydrogenase [Bacteroidaceae bacterium]